MQRAIDDAAKGAGRDPAAVERAVNLMEVPADASAAADALARVVDLGFTSLLVGVPGDEPVAAVRRLGEEVAPRLRDLVGEG